MRRFHEGGILGKLLEKYIPPARCLKDKNTAASLSIDALQGLFILVTILISMCTLVLLMEVMHFKLKNAKIAPIRQKNADIFLKSTATKKAPKNEDDIEVTDL